MRAPTVSLLSFPRASTKSCQGHLVDNECVLADVDDLVEIGDLEIYIDESLVINTFLSHGYFKSPNCLREIQSTVDKTKALMLTHEADPMKGGGPLEDIKEEIERRATSRHHLLRGTAHRHLVPYRRVPAGIPQEDLPFHAAADAKVCG